MDAVGLHGAPPGLVGLRVCAHHPGLQPGPKALHSPAWAQNLAYGGANEGRFKMERNRTK